MDYKNSSHKTRPDLSSQTSEKKNILQGGNGSILHVFFWLLKERDLKLLPLAEKIQIKSVELEVYLLSELPPKMAI